MPELSRLLNLATPDDLDPVDVDRVGRLSRQRQRRRYRARAAAAMVVAIGAVGGALLAGSGGEGVTEQVTASAPDQPTVTEGMGVWTEVAAVPFSNVYDLVPLSDGRLLAWGSTSDWFTDADGERGFPVLAIFDPDENAWSTVDHPESLDSLHLLPAQFADDRLAVIGSIDGDGRIAGEVFDASTGEWTPIQALDEIRVLADFVAWDGDRLVLVRTSPGEVAPVRKGFEPVDAFTFEPGEPDPTNPYLATIDYRVDSAQTWRWTFGADSWSPGLAPPLSMRSVAGSAFDGSRLAIVGGTEGGLGSADANLTRSDGAVYDIADDQWAPLPDLPWSGVHPGVGWIDSTLVVAGGEPDLEMGSDEADDDPNMLNPRAVQLSGDGLSWVELPSSPTFGATVSWASDFENPSGGKPVVQRHATAFGPDQTPGGVLVDGRWETTPTMTLQRWNDRLIALPHRMFSPRDELFTLSIRRGPNDWVPTAEAPFRNRLAAGIAVVGDKVFVVGGLTGTSAEPDTTAWVLDLSQSN